MAKITGFMDYKRIDPAYRSVESRLKDFDEIMIPLSEDDLAAQAARCMDCGIPFCHGAGCPLGNNIPEYNSLVYQQRWQEACELLHQTNNFPEFTGRICPALCEAACTLGINDDPVSARHIEYQIVEKGWEQGWIRPRPAIMKTGRKVAVIGSGPAGLAAAQQLARMGHSVTVFEKEESPGGLLRYGIPNFKLDKYIIDRRLEQLRKEGVVFQTGVKAGEDISVKYLRKNFDAICLTIGAGIPRNLVTPGRGLEGIHYAMEYLSSQNRMLLGENQDNKVLSAKDKVVAVIGGGDTGSDCVGTANRQGAKKVYQLEIMPKPSITRPNETPWPMWPQILRTSSSHKEGCERRWSVKTARFSGAGTRVEKLYGLEVEWTKDAQGRMQLHEKAGSEFELNVDMVLLAMGFVHPEHVGLVQELGLDLDQRGNLTANEFMTSQAGVFAAGDTVTGASLVVRAVDSGRRMASAVDDWLKRL